MSQEATAVVILGAYAFVILVTVSIPAGISIRRRRARERRFSQWAAQHGWRFGDADARLTALARHLVPGQAGGRHTQVVSDVLQCRHAGAPAYSFTYRWVTSTEHLGEPGPRSRIGRRTAQVVAVPLPGHLPMVQVTPEGFRSTLARSLGARDLRVESEAFNRAYRVVADDERVAHAVVHPRLMEQLLRPELLGFAWRVDQGWVYSWVDGRSEPERVGPMLDVVTAVRLSLPAHLLADDRTHATSGR
jgi:hypothetical protein